MSRIALGDLADASGVSARYDLRVMLTIARVAGIVPSMLVSTQLIALQRAYAVATPSGVPSTFAQEIGKT